MQEVAVCFEYLVRYVIIFKFCIRANTHWLQDKCVGIIILSPALSQGEGAYSLLPV